MCMIFDFFGCSVLVIVDCGMLICSVLFVVIVILRFVLWVVSIMFGLGL